MHEILRFDGCFFHIFRERYAPYMLHDSKNIYVSGKTHGDNYARLPPSQFTRVQMKLIPCE